MIFMPSSEVGKALGLHRRTAYDWAQRGLVRSSTAIVRGKPTVTACLEDCAQLRLKYRRRFGSFESRRIRDESIMRHWRNGIPITEIADRHNVSIPWASRIISRHYNGAILYTKPMAIAYPLTESGLKAMPFKQRKLVAQLMYEKWRVGGTGNATPR